MKKESNKETTFIHEIISWLFTFLGAVTIAVLIQSQIFSFSEVRMTSMMTTLIEGDELIVNKMAYWTKNPKRGDIIVFLEDEEVSGFLRRTNVLLRDISLKFAKDNYDKRLIKRIIGLPGEEITIKEGKVYINNELLEEQYLICETFEREVITPYIVPDDSLFVMGDNRTASKDSRTFGSIKINSIEGKATFRLMPFNRAGKLK